MNKVVLVLICMASLALSACSLPDAPVEKSAFTVTEIEFVKSMDSGIDKSKELSRQFLSNEGNMTQIRNIITKCDNIAKNIENYSETDITRCVTLLQTTRKMIDKATESDDTYTEDKLTLSA